MEPNKTGYAILAHNGKTDFTELFGGGNPAFELSKATFPSLEAAISHLRANEAYACAQQIRSANIFEVKDGKLYDKVKSYYLTWVEKWI